MLPEDVKGILVHVLEDETRMVKSSDKIDQLVFYADKQEVLKTPGKRSNSESECLFNV